MKINTRVVTVANLALAFSVPLRSSLASPIILHHGPKHENSTRSQQQSPATSGTFASASMNQYLSTERRVTSDTVEEEVRRLRQERERKAITSDTRDNDDKSTRTLFFHRFRRPATLQPSSNIFSRPALIQPSSGKRSKADKSGKAAKANGKRSKSSKSNNIVPSPPPVPSPTAAPPVSATPSQSVAPSSIPTTARPSSFPSQSPSQRPTTAAPSASPTTAKSLRPTTATARPTSIPASTPTKIPTRIPTSRPTFRPTSGPTSLPTALPVTSQPTGVQIPSVRFNIDLVNVPTADPNRASVVVWDSVIREAADKWEQIIVGDLPTENSFTGDLFDGFFDGFTYDVNPSDPASPQLDDIAIGYDFVDNLPSLQLGSGTWTRLRSDATSLPFSGGMHFNSNLITADPKNDPALREKLFWTVFHEIGHSLGFGTVWFATPFVCATKCTEGTGGDYSCPAAQAQFESLFPGQILAFAVDCGHWLQSQFEDKTWFDVMAPSYDLIRRPLATVISVGAMQDLGYVVNFGAADDPNALSFLTARDNVLPTANVPIFDNFVEPGQSVGLRRKIPQAGTIEPKLLGAQTPHSHPEESDNTEWLWSQRIRGGN